MKNRQPGAVQKEAARQEEIARGVLSNELKVQLEKKEVRLGSVRTGESRVYKFDLVSPDGKIVGDVKSGRYIEGKSVKESKVSGASDACVLLLDAMGAERRLLVFTDRGFYALFRESRQGQILAARGIEILHIEPSGKVRSELRPVKEPEKAPER